ncbi:hypothetical protein D3C72_1537080 [compost metagenome]
MQQLQLVRADVGQDLPRDRLVLVELGQEGAEDFGIGVRLVDAGEVGAPAPVLTRAIEEDLNAGLTALGMQGEDIGLGVAGALGVQARFHGDG